MLFYLKKGTICDKIPFVESEIAVHIDQLSTFYNINIWFLTRQIKKSKRGKFWKKLNCKGGWNSAFNNSLSSQFGLNINFSVIKKKTTTTIQKFNHKRQVVMKTRPFNWPILRLVSINTKISTIVWYFQRTTMHKGCNNSFSTQFGLMVDMVWFSIQNCGIPTWNPKTYLDHHQE